MDLITKPYIERQIGEALSGISKIDIDDYDKQEMCLLLKSNLSDMSEILKVCSADHDSLTKILKLTIDINDAVIDLQN